MDQYCTIKIIETKSVKKIKIKERNSWNANNKKD